MKPVLNQKSTTTISTLGEFGFISRLASGVFQHKSVITGIGDDAAVTVPTEGKQLLTSTDMLLEEVHFRRSWHDPLRLGRKSLAVSISDIAAMGGLPRWALLSLAMPADLPLDFMDDFMRGFLSMASEHEVTLIGGDTCSSRTGLTISVTIMGEQDSGRIVRRSGAMIGDDIWVTGTVGDAAFALQKLENGEDVEVGQLQRLLDPTPRIAASLALVQEGLVNAMIDVSDGLLADFGHIAEQSGVGGCISVADLPLSAEFRLQADLLDSSPYQLALSGGEDYELCFTAAYSNREKVTDCMKKCGIAATRIGIVTSSSGVVAINQNGSPYNIKADGFNHFT